jgi:hypothetical protein
MGTRRGAAAAAALAATVVVAGAAAAQAPGLHSVEPGRDGPLLTARVRTTHLPGSDIAASLDSGLPSAIEMQLDLHDERDRTVAEERVLFRVAYDLWDEVFRVEGGGADERFADLASLQHFLEVLPRLPVASFASVAGAQRHRIRAQCRLHMIAPRETERLERWVTGGTDRRESADGREISVGLSDVIRFFYKGAKRDADEASERFSPWFVPDELPESAEDR